ncbi:hypothetical protein HISP_19720 (plasmid) [Haloarcula hispanica N601]|uniref:Uncharacterized protein n=2 Tax=Haloarcula hispanica TaxID=51589 RepID=V5TT41_HALHI|nr:MULTISPECIES: hypothetical protein [Haloarcula]AEM59442.1 hypothetical protein HAH_5309 [Haloarcula hispanica ATCC 33960]AHB68288.1 hypothetical protein HISP_19720 [Haloarcula hispanica N601]KAA9404320.1 hypothetical protein Har1131_16075 [Haloarcula sp. CBA1131]
MGNGRYSSGDVFWAPDPYNRGNNPRPWLVLTADALPFSGEEYICAGLTLSDLQDNIAIGDNWLAGGNPDRESYCSPWVLATVKHDAVSNPQGRVVPEFTATVTRQSAEYITGDTDRESA